MAVVDPKPGEELIDARGTTRARICSVQGEIVMLERERLNSNKRTAFHLTIRFLASDACGWRRQSEEAQRAR